MAAERYGLHAVRVALRTDVEAEGLWYDAARRDPRLNEVLRLARDRKIALHAVTRAELDRMTGEGCHQGVLLRVPVEKDAAGGRSHPDLASLLDDLDEPALLLILDGVQDPHNLGACLRSADAAGAHAVIVPRDHAVGVTPAVRKVASGGAETVPVYTVTNLARTLADLKQRNIWLVGLDAGAGRSLYETDLKGSIALVLGAEGAGLRRLTREACDLTVQLPMRGVVESLNVSVAAGVCLYEVVRQRRFRRA